MIDANGERVDVTILTLMARHPRAEFVATLQATRNRREAARQLHLRHDAVTALCYAYGQDQPKRGRPRKVTA